MKKKKHSSRVWPGKLYDNKAKTTLNWMELQGMKKCTKKKYSKFSKKKTENFYFILLYIILSTEVSLSENKKVKTIQNITQYFIGRPESDLFWNSLNL